MQDRLEGHPKPFLGEVLLLLEPVYALKHEGFLC